MKADQQYLGKVLRKDQKWYYCALLNWHKCVNMICNNINDGRSEIKIIDCPEEQQEQNHKKPTKIHQEGNRRKGWWSEECFPQEKTHCEVGNMCDEEKNLKQAHERNL